MRNKFIICTLMLTTIFTLCACTPRVNTSANENEESAQPNEPSSQTEETISLDYDDLAQSLNDWVLGTEYGIENIIFDSGSNILTIVIPDEAYDSLQDFNKDDIATSITNLLSHYEVNPKEYALQWSNGDSLDLTTSSQSSSESSDNNPAQQSDDENTAKQVEANVTSETVNLIFLHHSVGENWLNDALNQLLNDNNYHVADTYYGWSDMGDSTDIGDWPDWFNNDVMPSVYNKMSTETAYNSIEPATSENTIIMFKSCFPNSDVGKKIDDEQKIYNSLLSYFAAHPDKMFILVTSSPMQHIPHSDKTRELTNWLVDENGWRKNYTENNLFVFDLYNVLTAPENHHMIVNGVEEHIINDSSNTLYYDSGGDDHPNGIGNTKATEEFVPLLNYWYEQFEN